jgi:putative transcriptional regulator
MFAKFMGVSVKTVEAWESGRNHPEGTACRLLTMTSNDPTFPVKSGIVSFA